MSYLKKLLVVYLFFPLVGFTQGSNQQQSNVKQYQDGKICMQYVLNLIKSFRPSKEEAQRSESSAFWGGFGGGNNSSGSLSGSVANGLAAQAANDSAANALAIQTNRDFSTLLANSVQCD